MTRPPGDAAYGAAAWASNGAFFGHLWNALNYPHKVWSILLAVATLYIWMAFVGIQYNNRKDAQT